MTSSVLRRNGFPSGVLFFLRPPPRPPPCVQASSPSAWRAMLPGHFFQVTMLARAKMPATGIDAFIGRKKRPAIRTSDRMDFRARGRRRPHRAESARMVVPGKKPRTQQPEKNPSHGKNKKKLHVESIAELSGQSRRWTALSDRKTSRLYRQ